MAKREAGANMMFLDLISGEQKGMPSCSQASESGSTPLLEHTLS